MVLRLLSQRTVIGLIFALGFLSFLASFRLDEYLLPRKSDTLTEPSSSTSLTDTEYQCIAFPASKDTLIVVKTGANEIHDKLPTQLLTALRCYHDILIFSDLEDRIGPFMVHDALRNASEKLKTEDPEFDYYRTLQEYRQNGEDITGLRHQTDQAAWKLDKYKFLHILEETWRMRPHRKWYVFIEADTYLVRTNLLLWLERLDPSQPHYFGSPTYANGEEFAHGGSGVVLSEAALSKFANGVPGIASQYEGRVKAETFGDYALMKALRDRGVLFSGRWPMFQAEKPATIPFGRGPDNGARHWCQPIVTMHHITPEEACAIWAFEQKRKSPRGPLLLQELYEGMVAPEISAKREDWDNISDDLKYRPPGVMGDRQKPREEMSALERDAHLSFEDCGRACEEQPRCFQHVYTRNECGFSYSYRLGKKRRPESGITVPLQHGYDHFVLYCATLPRGTKRIFREPNVCHSHGKLLLYASWDEMYQNNG